MHRIHAAFFSKAVTLFFPISASPACLLSKYCPNIHLQHRSLTSTLPYRVLLKICSPFRLYPSLIFAINFLLIYLPRTINVTIVVIESSLQKIMSQIEISNLFMWCVKYNFYCVYSFFSPFFKHLLMTLQMPQGPAFIIFIHFLLSLYSQIPSSSFLNLMKIYY